MLYDAKCPVCGKLNKDMYLEETEGRFVCDRCGSETEIPRFKKPKRIPMVDHIIPIKQGGAKYDQSNLQSLCWACHSRKSAEEGSRWNTKPHEYK